MNSEGPVSVGGEALRFEQRVTTSKDGVDTEAGNSIEKARMAGEKQVEEELGRSEANLQIFNRFGQNMAEFKQAATAKVKLVYCAFKQQCQEWAVELNPARDRELVNSRLNQVVEMTRMHIEKLKIGNDEISEDVKKKMFEAIKKDFTTIVEDYIEQHANDLSSRLPRCIKDNTTPDWVNYRNDYIKNHKAKRMGLFRTF